MNYLVHNEGRVSAQELSTLVALTGLLSSMTSPMHGEDQLIKESFPTLIVLIGFFPCGFSDVLSGLTDSIPTVLTFIWLLSLVSSLALNEVSFLAKGIPTLLTFIWLLYYMCPEVLSQG